MSDNSLASLLQLMKAGSVTQGWGAVSVFNRERLNRLLEQQYIDRFNTLNVMPLFNGSIAINEDRREFVALEAIGLGQPRVSFDDVLLDNSTATVTMNVLSGRYIASSNPPGAERIVSSTFNITESQGLTLEMEVDLSLVEGEIDRQGKVTLNLAEAVEFRCNLAGDNEAVNAKLAEFFNASFAALPAHKAVFHLGMLDLKGYSQLTPKSFRILTQVAPGATVRGASNYRDGGVVVFIQLQGNTGPGRYPPASNFPYLIPDDKAVDGSDKFSASLVLSEPMLPYVEDNQLEVLGNLLFPGQHVFEERQRSVPHDLAVFGNISPKQTLITLEPTFQTIKAGHQQRFTLRDGKGQVIDGSNWRAVSLRSHLAEGHGKMEGGLYTAVLPAQIGYDTLHVVVSVDHVEAGITYTASALLLVVFDSMLISPRLATFQTQAQTQTVSLKASTLDDDPMSWKLLEPVHGTLTYNGHQGLFTANERSRRKSLVVQQIEATAGESRQASLLLINAAQLLQISPSYVPAVRKSASVQFMDDPTLLPEVPRRWKVLGGSGTVDHTGRFTAPAQVDSASSVVQCEIVRNGVVFSGGYCVVDLQDLDPEESWVELKQFTIKVPGAPGNANTGSVFANGWQQVQTQIVVEPMPYNDKPYRLSVLEKESMTLVDFVSGAEIKPVDGDGIPEGDTERWGFSRLKNRFLLASPLSATGDSIPADDPFDNADRIPIFIHSRDTENSPKEFEVKFQADSTGRWWKSTDISDVNRTVHITPKPIPRFAHGDYTLERKRADGGSGGPGGEPEDDFDFHLVTVDYWSLTYVGNIRDPGSQFETLEFLPEDEKKPANTSMIRWESNQLDETMFSWTGYVFQDPQKTVDLEKVKFDLEAGMVVKDRDDPEKNLLDVDFNRSMFEHGTLLISLHRHDNVRYVRKTDPVRDKLSKDLIVLLVDKNGNPHRRRISYLPTSSVSDRNHLEHRLFSPAS